MIAVSSVTLAYNNCEYAIVAYISALDVTYKDQINQTAS